MEFGETARHSWRNQSSDRTKAFLGFTGGGGVAVQVGLNGVRGMAVVPVVLYHLGYTGLVGGGQLVMSLFFTQSGFLITTLILQEYGTTGQFRLRPFWAARARRLIPPAWITLAVVGLLRVTTDALSNGERADIVTTFLNVSNWYFGSARVFAAGVLGTRSSDLNHAWSLSIEEQFYVALALLTVTVVAFAKRPVVALRLVAVVGALISFVLPFAFDMDHNRVFFGTDTRAGELLVGVAMATVVVSRPVRVGILHRQVVVAVLGAVALAVAIALWHFLTPATAFLQNGLLPAGTALWVFVILGAMIPVGPVTWLMHRTPLLWLGRLSYGIYMYHVPVFAFGIYYLHERTLSRSVLLVAITLALAEASYHLVEMPIRRQRLAGRPLLAGALATLAVIATTLVIA